MTGASKEPRTGKALISPLSLGLGEKEACHLHPWFVYSCYSIETGTWSQRTPVKHQAWGYQHPCCCSSQDCLMCTTETFTNNGEIVFWTTCLPLLIISSEHHFKNTVPDPPKFSILLLLLVIMFPKVHCEKSMRIFLIKNINAFKQLKEIVVHLVSVS